MEPSERIGDVPRARTGGDPSGWEMIARTRRVRFHLALQITSALALVLAAVTILWPR